MNTFYGSIRCLPYKLFLPIYQHQLTNQFVYCPITYEPRCTQYFFQTQRLVNIQRLVTNFRYWYMVDQEQKSMAIIIVLQSYLSKFLKNWTESIIMLIRNWCGSLCKSSLKIFKFISWIFFSSLSQSILLRTGNLCTGGASVFVSENLSLWLGFGPFCILVKERYTFLMTERHSLLDEVWT